MATMLVNLDLSRTRFYVTNIVREVPTTEIDDNTLLNSRFRQTELYTTQSSQTHT